MRSVFITKVEIFEQTNSFILVIRLIFLSWQPTQPSGHAPSRSVSGVGGSFSFAEVQPRHGESDADCSPEPALELRAVPPRRHPAAARASPRWRLPQRGESASGAPTPIDLMHANWCRQSCLVTTRKNQAGKLNTQAQMTLICCYCLQNNVDEEKNGNRKHEWCSLKRQSTSGLHFIFDASPKAPRLLPQIRSLRRERVETIVEKEELVDDPMDNGTLHSPPDWFAAVERLW